LETGKDCIVGKSDSEHPRQQRGAHISEEIEVKHDTVKERIRGKKVEEENLVRFCSSWGFFQLGDGILN
jgi:hypothetical protein